MTDSDETVNYDPTARVLRVTEEPGLRAAAQELLDARDALSAATPQSMLGPLVARCERAEVALRAALAAKDAER